MAESIPPKLREQVAQRSHHRCEYCLSQSAFSPTSFSIEHIYPRSKGGTNALENLAYACQGCNSRKYTHTEAIDPITGQMAALYNPREMHWEEHFRWSDDFTEMLGISPIGRASIAKMQLNRHALVNLRGILAGAGLHPPVPES